MGPKNTSGYRLFLLSILAIALSACGGGGGGEGSGSGGSGGSGGALEIKILAANDGTNGTELWKTDGTAAGTVLVKNINTTAPGSSSSPSRFTEFNGATYFSADDSVNGIELWKSDGSAAGTQLLKDICPGACSGTMGF